MRSQAFMLRVHKTLTTPPAADSRFRQQHYASNVFVERSRWDRRQDSVPQYLVAAVDHLGASMAGTRSGDRSRMSVPDDCLVDGLVAVLKRRRRWQRDGGSLRLLNKYWCLEISKRVDFISIPMSPIRRFDRFSSLLKFPGLTELNGMYLPVDRIAASEGYPLLFRTLKLLPRLKRLTLDSDVLKRLSRSDVEGLEVEDVVVEGIFSSPQCLINLSALKLQSLGLVFLDVDALHRVLSEMPSLERLKLAWTWHRAMEHSDDMLVRQTRIQNLSRNLSLLPRLHRTVSLHLKCYNDLDLAPLNNLPKLSELILWVWRESGFTSALKTVMRQLTHLELHADNRGISVPRNFLETASRLESLSLFEFSFDGNAFLQRGLRGLHSLSLTCCRITNQSIPWSALPSLTSVGFHCIRGCQGVCLPYIRHLASCPNLEDLAMCLRANEVKHVLHSVCRIKSLQSIEIKPFQGIWDSLRFNDFEELKMLPRLDRVVIRASLDDFAKQELAQLKHLQNLVDADVVITDRMFDRFE